MSKLAEWELAEVERSRAEAAHVDVDSLRIHNTERYTHPPANPSYPLEYCFYLLGDVRGKRVLDLGCGTGENTLLLALMAAEVYALDISEELVELAKKRLKINLVSAERVHFMAGSAHDTGIPDESLDIVLGIAILHHLDLGLVSREVFRVLKKGGRAIFQEPVRDSASIRFLRRLVPYRAPDVSPFERPLTTGEITQFAAPFRDFEMRPFDLPHVSLAGVLSPKLVPWAHRSDRWLLNAMPFLIRYAGVRVFQVTK
jgi:ubiquinone/menaquinone biosynthesis C-methylase UbiE